MAAVAKPKQSTKSLAEVAFTVGHIRRQLKKQALTSSVTPKAAIYIAGAMTFLMEEILDLSRQIQKQQGDEKSRMTPRHVMLAFSCDPDLDRLLGRDRFARSGVPEHICAALTQRAPKKQKKTKGDPEAMVDDAPAPKEEAKPKKPKKQKTSPAEE